MAYLLPEARSANSHGVLGWLTGPWMGYRLFEYYRPVTSLALYGEYRLFGEQSAGWQVVSLILHMSSTAMLATLCRRVFSSGLAALVGAGVWGFRDRQWDAIAWTPAQTDLLAGFFALACLLSLAIFLDSAGAKWLICAAVSGILSVGSKEAALVLPLLASLLILRNPSQSRRTHWRMIGGAWLLAFVFFVWRYHALGGLGFTPGQVSAHSGGGRLRPDQILSHLWSFLLPAPLGSAAVVSAGACPALFASLLLIAELRRRRLPRLWLLAAGAAAFLLVTVFLGGPEWWLVLQTYESLLAGIFCISLLALTVIWRPYDSLFVLGWGVCAWLPLYHIVYNVAGNVSYLADTYWALAWSALIAAVLRKGRLLLLFSS